MARIEKCKALDMCGIDGLFYIEKGEAYMLDAVISNEIASSMLRGREVHTEGRTLYPKFSAPKSLNDRRKVAWRIHDGDSNFSIRWYWQVREHTRDCGNCSRLDGGLCAVKVVRYETWNEEKHIWEVEPMVNHATPEQEVVLD